MPVVVRSLRMMLVQPLDDSAVGFTHPSSVMPVVNPNVALFSTVTSASMPLNESALPNRPATCTAPEIVPLLSLPDDVESFATVPVVSLKFSAITRPFVLPSTRIDAVLENAELLEALVAVGVGDVFVARTR